MGKRVWLPLWMPNLFGSPRDIEIVWEGSCVSCKQCAKRWMLHARRMMFRHGSIPRRRTVRT